MSRLVDVSHLSVMARTDDADEVPIVKDVSFSVQAGEVVALIGESGSGKTTIALSLLGYVRRGCRISGGQIRIGETDLVGADTGELIALRGRRVAYVAQSASASFNPARTIMDQVIEGACAHGLMSREAARNKAVALFRSLALPSPETLGLRYPHQVSGGQLQRLMAAMALMTDPEVVVFDEPTTALDVTTQIEVLRAFKQAIKERQISAVYVSHDLAVVAQMADRVVVLRNGQIQEQGGVGAIIASPQNAYTRNLMQAAESPVRLTQRDTQRAMDTEPVLRVEGLSAGYGKPDASGMPALRILEGVDLVVRKGATMGVIGESGSGKSTLAYVIAGLLAPAKGAIAFKGRTLGGTLRQRDKDLYRRIQLVFQNADTVLNPAHTIGDILARPLRVFERCSSREIPRRVAALLDMVKLPAAMARRRPAELSGGQKQRINLARALAAEPELIICDEVTSALDTVVGAAILDLLVELRRDLDMSYVFISHDISTVRAICDDITVLLQGRKVDACRPGELSIQPRAPYTNLLVDSVPELRLGWLEEACRRIDERAR
ncbi:ABC transporter ATP-binding protein [Bordetella sp. FB-8]|uniref:ABC transporter ATP-binding protein n=1 Tax=Bordetella sp. FB-8 TaxID=1159870 RepID=UPI000360018C|nr:ABC transporter ATP-binding protein [Bordetella sp. FB-8]